MKSRTVVCVYGKNEPVEMIMERLNAMYVSNYSESYVYGALIDLPDAISYRTAGDLMLEEKAQELIRVMNARYDGAFFCAIRQRRIRMDKEYRYACEEGAVGALKALWRSVKGKGTEIFPVFSGKVLNGTERVYLSAQVGSVGDKDNGYIDVIEPNGVFGLASLLDEYEAAFAFTGAIESENNGFLTDKTEALFCADALDKLLSCEPVAYKKAFCDHIGMVRYPAKSFFSFEKEMLLL